MLGFNLVSSLLAVVLLSTRHVHAGSPDLVIPLLGSDPCTWGPSYWCASEDNMKRCGVTKEQCEKYADYL
ncbi:saposin isoform a [Fusarium heterosporum]|uniref:Saposin isoform a n=1 Tax=Fusarium heterosporum TaxID=42747 RepID=A0A8H5T4T2_FUSHE|nr:saposin isoform a [Fusarium heterosporum]